MRLIKVVYNDKRKVSWLEMFIDYNWAKRSPWKSVTIPGLELPAAVLAARPLKSA